MIVVIEIAKDSVCSFAKQVYYRLSHNLLNFWNKLQAGFSTSGLDNYAALCNRTATCKGELSCERSCEVSSQSNLATQAGYSGDLLVIVWQEEMSTMPNGQYPCWTSNHIIAS